MPSMGMAGLLPDDPTSVGDALRGKLRQRYGSTIGFDGRGEMIPNDDCYCELDPNAHCLFQIATLVAVELDPSARLVASADRPVTGGYPVIGLEDGAGELLGFASYGAFRDALTKLRAYERRVVLLTKA